MEHYSTSPKALAYSIYKNRTLIAVLAWKDVIGRYRGSWLGMLWSFLIPILMLCVYTFVFSVVFQARWAEGSQSKSEFAIILFSGLMVFSMFAECITSAPNLVLNNVNYVKKIVFPLEILPIVKLVDSLFHFAINIFVWFAFYLIWFGLPKISAFLFPIVILPLVFTIVGMSLVISSLAVYFRDIGQITYVATTALSFLSPVFYPASALPEAFRPIFNLNPLTGVIENMRDILVWGKIISFESWFLSLSISIAITCVGFWWFQKTRKGFADVI